MIKILIVDDDPITLLLLNKILSKMGYHVDQASNGKKALQMLTESHYNIFISDWIMLPCTP